MADDAPGSIESRRASTGCRRAPPDGPSTEVVAALRRYRCGASVASVAAELDVSFDALARLIIDAGVRRAVPTGRPPRPGTSFSLDDADWVRAQLEAGRTIGDIAHHLGVDADVAGAAVTAHGFTVASTLEPPRDAEGERTELAARFRSGSEEAQAADVALRRARALQASAVSELVRTGLTVPAVADRLGVHDDVVLELLTESAGSHLDVVVGAARWWPDAAR